MKIGVIGCGMVGGTLVRAARQKGFTVFATDKHKPEFSDAPDKLLSSDLLFLCLPTPTNELGEQDLTSIMQVCSSLSSEGYRGPVVLKSTVLPGTTNFLAKKFALRMVHNPEFLTEANAFKDLMDQPVVLLGSNDRAASLAAGDFWKKFDTEVGQMSGTAVQTEFAKYMHNCFLAIKVSFFNEIFEAAGAENFDVARFMAIAVGKIGETHTKVPGPDGKFGFGGSCFPKDTAALLSWGKFRGLNMSVLEGAVSGNKRRRN